VRRSVAGFLVAVGLADLVTGLALLAFPNFVVGLLEPAAVPLAAPVFVRWIGLFVASVGAVYLYPWLLRGGALRRDQRLATVVEVTTLLRTAVALFVAFRVTTGALGPGWLVVALFDGGVAMAQSALLRREGIDAG
jgi:hypothetical protein